MNPFFPIFVDLTRRRVLVVGGGEVAVGKVSQMLAHQAVVTVVSPEARDEIKDWAARGHLSWIARPFEDADLGGHYLVIAATDDDAVNGRVFKLAEGRCMFANSVDDVANCSFIMAAVASAGPLQVAVSSGGASPTLAGRLRDRFLTQMLDEGMDTLAAFLGRMRGIYSEGLADFAAKRRFWRAVLDSSVPDLVAEGREAQAEATIQALWEAETGLVRTAPLGAGS